MELECVHAVAEAERLIAAEIGRGEEFGARRQIEGFAVPVEDSLQGES